MAYLLVEGVDALHAELSARGVKVLTEPTSQPFANVMGLVIFSLAIPWGYVFREYVREPGDRWTWSKEPSAGLHPENR